MKLYFSLLCLLLGTNFLFGQSEVAVDSIYFEENTLEMEAQFSKGNYAEALVIAKDLLAKAKPFYGDDDELYGNCLDQLGMIYHHSGDLVLAREYLEAGVAHAKQYYPDAPSGAYYQNLNNLGMLYKDIGELGQATHCLQTTVDGGLPIWGEDNVASGIAVHNLSLALSALGQYDKALRYANESARLTELSVGKEHYKYAFRLASRANITANQGHPEAAMPIQKEVFEILEATLGVDNYWYMVSMRNYGRFARDAGKLLVAETYLEQSAERLLNKYGKTHQAYIKTMSSLGEVYGLLGKDDLALQTLTEAKNIMDEYGGIDLSNQGHLLTGLGQLYEQDGQIQEAVLTYLELESFIEEVLMYQMDQLGEWEQQAYLKSMDGHYQKLLSFVYRHPEETAVVIAAFDLSLLFKELSLGTRRSLLASIENNEDSILTSKLQQWKKLERRLAREYSRPKAKQAADFEEIIEKTKELERELAARSQVFRSLQTQMHWEDIAEQLGEAEVVVEVVKFNHYAVGANHSDSDNYFALVIRAGDSAPHLVPLFEQNQLPSLRKTRQLYNFKETGSGGNLHQLVWQPLQAAIGDAKTIYWSPAGSLYRINFGAIPIDAEQTLSDRYEWFQLGNLSSLMLSNEADLGTNKNALVFGGLQYDNNIVASEDANNSTAYTAADGSLGRGFDKLRANPWEYLRWSAQEAASTTELLENKDWTVKMKTQAEGTEAAFKQACAVTESPRLIHLATHAYFFPSPSEQDSLGFKSSAHPLIRSGMIMAGGNIAWQGEIPSGVGEDNILTAYEITQMDLEDTELVVLSACNTGLGDVVGNEGVYGLQRAFKTAGAKYVLMSLWSVDDRKTYEFMNYFYDYWQQEKRSIPAAYQKAQQSMQQDYALPFNPQAWAGFILVQ